MINISKKNVKTKKEKNFHLSKKYFTFAAQNKYKS